MSSVTENILLCLFPVRKQEFADGIRGTGSRGVRYPMDAI